MINFNKLFTLNQALEIVQTSSVNIIGRSLLKESLLTDYQCTSNARTMARAVRSVLYCTCVFRTETVRCQLTHMYER